MGPEDIIRNATLKAILDGVQPAAFAERGPANLDQIVSALHKHKAKIIKEASGTDDEDALVTKVCSVPAEESTEADKMRLVKIWARTVISKRYFTVSSYTKDYTSIILRILDRECWDDVPRASAEVMTFLLRDWYNNTFGVESLLPHIVDARNEALRRDEEVAEKEIAAQAEKMRLAEEKKQAQKDKTRRAKRPLEPASAASAAAQPPAAKKPRQEGVAGAVPPPPPPQGAPAKAAQTATPAVPAATAAPGTPATPSTPFVEEVSADTAKGTFAAPTVQEPADAAPAPAVAAETTAAAAAAAAATDAAPAVAAADAAAAEAAAPAAAVEAEDAAGEEEITMEKIVATSKQIVMQLRMGAVGVSTAHDLAEELALPEELVKATIKIMEEHLQVMFDPEVGAVYLL